MGKYKFKNNAIFDLTNLRILGERVVLVSITSSYADVIFTEFNTEITYYMIPSPANTINETHDFISTAIDGMRSGYEIVLAITNNTGEFLGCVGLHGRLSCETPECGIWLRKSAHGFGYGQEAVKTLIAWAQAHILFDHIIYPVAKDNNPSRKIPESLGGTIYKKEKKRTGSGVLLDFIVYHII